MFLDQGNRHLIDLKDTFIYACRENNITKVRACLDLGVDVYVKFGDNVFGLIFAVIENYIELCETLLGQPGIDVDRILYDGADNQDNQEIFRILISISSVDWNLLGSNGDNALTYALKERKTS